MAHLLGGEAAPALVACVSDGAGSASRSHEGAQAACDAIARRAAGRFETTGSFASVSHDDAVAWCNAARDAIKDLADGAELPEREFACTLGVALASPGHAVFFQIGDGAIVARRGGAYGVVFWPQSGEYANSTNFLTQPGFQDNLEFHRATGDFDEVALFSDGLERLALSFDTQTPHAPFFDPLMNAVRATKDLSGLNAQLNDFLASPTVQTRTDDDTTVILAARVADR